MNLYQNIRPEYDSNPFAQAALIAENIMEVAPFGQTKSAFISVCTHNSRCWYTRNLPRTCSAHFQHSNMNIRSGDIFVQTNVNNKYKNKLQAKRQVDVSHQWSCLCMIKYGWRVCVNHEISVRNVYMRTFVCGYAVIKSINFKFEIKYHLMTHIVYDYSIVRH